MFVTKKIHIYLLSCNTSISNYAFFRHFYPQRLAFKVNIFITSITLLFELQLRCIVEEPNWQPNNIFNTLEGNVQILYHIVLLPW